MTTLPTSPQPRRQNGFALIESLIAMVVMALGILGILGVQMRTLTDTSTTVRRAQAIRLIEDLSERMKVNPNAVADINTYVSGFGDTPPYPPANDCTSDCGHSDLTTMDISVWKKMVATTLPGGQASIFVPPAEAAVAEDQRRQLGIMIAWRENERDTSTGYKNDIDATKIKDGANYKDQGGTAATCPDGFTCHVQYVQLAERCWPDVNFPGKYFCAGS